MIALIPCVFSALLFSDVICKFHFTVCDSDVVFTKRCGKFINGRIRMFGVSELHGCACGCLQNVQGCIEIVFSGQLYF